MNTRATRCPDSALLEHGDRMPTTVAVETVLPSKTRTRAAKGMSVAGRAPVRPSPTGPRDDKGSSSVLLSPEAALAKLGEEHLTHRLAHSFRFRHNYIGSDGAPRVFPER